jgi:hypothetical protein
MTSQKIKSELKKLENPEKVDNFKRFLKEKQGRNTIFFGLTTPQIRDILRRFTEDKFFWVQRIAIVSTWQFIKNKQLNDTFEIATILLHHDENLLIENGCYKTMPRTMLRYSIEKFPEPLRKKFLAGTI